MPQSPEKYIANDQALGVFVHNPAVPVVDTVDGTHLIPGSIEETLDHCEAPRATGGRSNSSHDIMRGQGTLAQLAP